MPFNKSTGNMYEFVDATWNPVQGFCPHQCPYCYGTRIWRLAGLTEGQVFKENYLEDDLYAPIKGKEPPHTLFVCSTTDLFAGRAEWIKAVINHCGEYPENTYLLQTKNPLKMIGWHYPPATIVGTTIETDKPGLSVAYSDAPYPSERAVGMAYLKKYQLLRTMVSIEPIMEFNLKRMVYFIKLCEPDFVSIGADSTPLKGVTPIVENGRVEKRPRLPEPKGWEVEMLIKELKKFTDVRIKPNLSRIIGDGPYEVL